MADSGTRADEIREMQAEIRGLKTGYELMMRDVTQLRIDVQCALDALKSGVTQAAGLMAAADPSR